MFLFCSDSRPFGPYYYGKTVFHTKVRKRLVGVWRRIATRGDKSNWLQAAILTALAFILPCLNLCGLNPQRKYDLFSIMSIILYKSDLKAHILATIQAHINSRLPQKRIYYYTLHSGLLCSCFEFPYFAGKHLPQSGWMDEHQEETSFRYSVHLVYWER